MICSAALIYHQNYDFARALQLILIMSYFKWNKKCVDNYINTCIVPFTFYPDTKLTISNNIPVKQIYSYLYLDKV